MPQNHIADPQSKLDYKFDFANTRNGGDTPDWLAEDEVISSHTVVVDDNTLVIGSHELTDSNSSVTVWLSGGTLGQTYLVTCHIVTNQGREDDRTITVTIYDR